MMQWMRKKAAHLRKGELAEQQACDYLQGQGLVLIRKNYRCKRGEIDLIMKQHNSLVFVEVRFRKNRQFGGALESITAAKQNKLRLTALHYLQQHGEQQNSRFDVVAITGEGKTPQLEWIQNAF